ncbi:MAG: penicillin-binding protein 2 [Bacteroidales bacterium]|nr:penicillin-binding protein 2 [Bacteroidales bacterium]
MYSRRNIIISGIIVLVLSVIAIKLFYIQVVDTSYKHSANNNVLRYVTQYPARGLIFDRHGELLVANRMAYDILVVKNQVRDLDTALLASLLDVTRAQVREAFDQIRQQRGYSPRKAVVLFKQVSDSAYARFQEKMYLFPGFEAQPRMMRAYQRPVAAHLLGYVGEVNEAIMKQNPYYQLGDYIGINGIERAYEEQLRGIKGTKIYMVDVHNRIQRPYEEGRYDSVPQIGRNMTCTIDINLQEYGERLMQNKIGSVVAIEPRTGEILAMVSAPTFDPSLLVGRARTANYRALQLDTLQPLFNRSIMALYPPGSTFKVVNALVGLQEGVVAPTTRYACAGRYPIGRGVGCHGHFSPLSLPQAIQTSCNTYFCYVFRSILDNPRYPSIKTAFDAWAEYVRSFGYGSRLGVDLPNELGGVVPGSGIYDKVYRGVWSSLTVISLSIGQGELLVTPLQMANLVSTIANRGYYITPHVVRSVEGSEDLAPQYAQRHYAGVDSTWYQYVIAGMEQAVNGDASSGGTARWVALPGASICGKTGTSENPHGNDHSVFFAFAPKDDPQIAIAVYVENAGFGGTWAAPIASLMIEKYLNGSVSRTWMEERILNANLLDRHAKKK